MAFCSHFTVIQKSHFIISDLPLPQPLAITTLMFMPMVLFFPVSYKWNHAVGSLLSVASFSQYNAFEIHPHSCFAVVVPFYCQGVFHVMDVPQFVFYPFSSWSTLRWFAGVGDCDWSFHNCLRIHCIYLFVHLFIFTFSFFLGKYLSVGFLGQMIRVYIYICKKLRNCSQSGCPTFAFLPNVWTFEVFRILLTALVVCFCQPGG